MTRAQLKQRIRVLGGHLFNTGADQDPFGLDLLLIEMANQIARNTDCLVGRRYLDSVANEDEYCAPDIYKIRGIYFLNSAGDYKRIRQVNWSARIFDSQRNNTTSNMPDIVAVYGMNRIRFKPAPSTATTNGIMVEGFMQPGDIWQYNASGTIDTSVPAEDHECPLPPVAHDCLVYAVLLQRAIQLRDQMGIQLYSAEYNRRLGDVEAFAAMYHTRVV
jgi:hypothetical protein